MNAAQYKFTQARERKRKKAQLNMKSDSPDNGFILSPKMDPPTYTTAFNNYVNKLKTSEYKSKNPDLFRWNQKIQYMNKLTLPLHLRDIHHVPSFSSRVTNDSSQDDMKPYDGVTSKRPNHRAKTGANNKRKKVLSPEFDSNLRVQTSPGKLKKPIEIDLEQYEGLSPSPLRTKTTYPATRVQMGLLSGHSDEVMTQIPNHQYMLNHFNKRNHAINKIFSQMQTDESLLDRDQIQRETITKIAYVSRPFTLHKHLRPKTHESGYMSLKSPPSKRDIMSPPAEFVERKKSGVGELTLERNFSSQKRLELNLQQVSPIMGEEVTKAIKSKSGKSNIWQIRPQRDIREINTALKRRESEVGKKKKEEHLEKGLVRHVEYGLKQLEDISSLRMCTSPDDGMRRSQKSFVQVRSPEDLPERAQTEQDEYALRTNDKLDSDNIFHFGNYFKKKYMERGTCLEMSSNLKARIASFEKDVSGAIKRIEFMSPTK